MNTSTKSVLETIFDWSESRPIWQRDALRRIVAGGTPDAEAIGEIVQLAKKEHGAEDVPLSAVPLAIGHLPANPNASASITLVSLGSVAGVNQLAAGQTLSFESNGLTVVYGKNGAGKSGYARILKRACRARHSGTIMPDVENPTSTGAATASVVLGFDGRAQPPVIWTDSDQPHPTMSAISVFDRDCASVHIKGPNEVAFRPFGLDIPDDLAGVCIKVKAALTAEQTQLAATRDPIFTTPTWTATTAVGKFMSGLSADTQTGVLEALAIVTDAERARHAQLSQDLAKNPVEAAKEQRLISAGISKLATLISGIEQTHSDTSFNSAKAKADNARSLRAAVKVAAETAFAHTPVSGVGAGPWKLLWESARSFAQQDDTHQTFPPNVGDSCLLCHQPITDEAHRRMQDFERFVRDDIENRATAAEQDHAQSVQLVNNQKINTQAVDATIERIAITDPDFAAIINAFITSGQLRWTECVASFENGEPLTLSPFTQSPHARLLTLAADANTYAEQLERAANADGRKVLVAEQAELTDRLAASTLLSKAKAEIARLAQVRVIQSALAETDTRNITKLGNDIADTIITPRLQDRFQSEIVQLAAEKVRVKVERSGGQYGSPQYQVRLFSNPSAKIHEVLSEGEQTCVALAAFLAELSTASHNSALIFDDPVTSLDHRWRQQVAKRLVKESATRQIIVFTHDLVFVNDLHDMAVQSSTNVKTLSLDRGSSGTGIVKDGLPWQWGRAEARIDGLEKALSAAKKLYDANDEENYRFHASHIYSNLRSTWERCLEDIVFAGVIYRHRDYINTKDLKKVVVVDENDIAAFSTGFKKCCDQTDAHDPSRGRDGESPNPTEIAADITALKDWVAAMRLKHKQIQ